MMDMAARSIKAGAPLQMRCILAIYCHSFMSS